LGRKLNKSIAIVRNGKDLLRITPINPDAKRIEIKFSFRRQLFEVNYLCLGENRPHRIVPSNDGELSITYHKGNSGKPICVHIKQDFKGQNIYYKELPLKYFNPPSGNDISMTPICKISFPFENSYLKYKSKQEHETLYLDNNENAVEMYIIGSEYNFEDAMLKYPVINLLQLIQDIEFYANGVIETCTDKNSTFLKKQLAHRMFRLENGIGVVFVPFYQREIIPAKTKILFLENEFHEIPLLKRLVCYRPTKNNNDTFSKPHSIVEDNELRGINTPELKTYLERLENRYYPIIEKLRVERLEINNNIWENTKKFIELIIQLQQDVEIKIKCGLIKPTGENNHFLWFSLPLWYRSFDLHLLLAKYLGRTEVSLYNQKISRSPNPQRRDEMRVRINVISNLPLDTKNIIENHTSLALPECDIDLLFGEYKKFGATPKGYSVIASPTRYSEERFLSLGFSSIKKDIIAHGYTITDEEIYIYDWTNFNKELENRKLIKIWDYIHGFERRKNRMSK